MIVCGFRKEKISAIITDAGGVENFVVSVCCNKFAELRNERWKIKSHVYVRLLGSKNIGR